MVLPAALCRKRILSLIVLGIRLENLCDSMSNVRGIRKEMLITDSWILVDVFFLIVSIFSFEVLHEKRKRGSFVLSAFYSNTSFTTRIWA